MHHNLYHLEMWLKGSMVTLLKKSIFVNGFSNQDEFLDALASAAPILSVSHRKGEQMSLSEWSQNGPIPFNWSEGGVY